MAIDDRLILPEDVLLIPVRDLSAEQRRQFQADETDVAVTRQNSRTPSRIVDADTAELLEVFRTQSTIVQALMRFCQRRGLPAEQTLEDVFPVLQQLLKSQILVPGDSALAERLSPRLKVGQTVGNFVIVRCVQSLPDTDLYEATAAEGKQVAIKLQRQGSPGEFTGHLDHEIRILQHLKHNVGPQLVTSDVFEDQPFAVMEWCHGVSVADAAEALRGELSHDFLPRMRELLVSVARTYSRLHKQNVIHGDVHPRNLLVDKHGNVRIVDFGLSRRTDSVQGDGVVRRGGISYFYEPELVRAKLDSHILPDATELSEQYAIGALLYLLYSGRHYLDFSAEKAGLSRQIANDPPRRLLHPARELPGLEAALSRSLRKFPSERFTSLAEFADVLESLELPQPRSVVRLPRPERDRFIQTTFDRMGFTGPLIEQPLPTAPRNSVNYGAAGIAYACYRLSLLRGDAELLSLADVWASKAGRALSDAQSFYSEALQITPETVGRTALYHSASGVYAVQALISHAMHDVASHQAAVDSFVAAAEIRCENPDLTLGLSGTLLGCTLLLDATPEDKYRQNAGVRAVGDRMMQELCDRLDAYSVVQNCRELQYLGIAHGWAGVLYAILLWCEASGKAIPESVGPRLAELAACGVQSGQRQRWPIRLSSRGLAASENSMSGWCNGSAGYVFLWTMVHRTLNTSGFLKLAEMAAEDVWQDDQEFDSLCCGLAGSAYALLNVFRATGDQHWLDRAENLTDRAISSTRNSQLPDSLYKGSLGVGLLAAEIEDPTFARMPVFEREGWGRQSHPELL